MNLCKSRWSGQRVTPDSNSPGCCCGTRRFRNRHFILRGAQVDVRCLTELYPQLRGWGDAPCKPLSVDTIAGSGADVVFLSTPHEASLELVPALLAANPELRVVDLSGAFRFRDRRDFASVGTN